MSISYVSDLSLKSLFSSESSESFNLDPTAVRRGILDDLVSELGVDHPFLEMQRKLSAETTTEDHLRMFNQNSFNNGIFNLYPYMTDATFSLFFSAPFDVLSSLSAIKIPIKSLLEAFFDNEFIYRPKIGFHNPLTHT